jgi:hypothetical protein
MSQAPELRNARPVAASPVGAAWLHFSAYPHSSRWHWHLCQWSERSDQEIPGPPNRDPDSRFRPNRESGIPCFPIPAESGSESPDFPKKPGNRRNRDSDFLSDEYQLQWTRNILSREYHASAFTGSMRLLFRVRDSEREHAAVSDEH